MIDLRAIADIGPYDKGNSPDYSRFNVDDGQGKVFKFRAASDAEGKRWIDGLNDWKDFFLMNM